MVYLGRAALAPGAVAFAIIVVGLPLPSQGKELPLSSDRLETDRRSRCRPPARRRRHRLNLVQLTDGPGLRVLKPERAWGTALVTRQLRQVMAEHARRFPGAPPVWVHDISRQGGGKISGHCSHRTGQDVDIRLALRDPQAGYVDATAGTLDLERTLALILGLIRSCDVDMIFVDRELQRALYAYAREQGVTRRALKYLFQYPYRRASGVVRHRDHHRNHMHVRFRDKAIPLDLHGAIMLCKPSVDPVDPRPLVQRLLDQLRVRSLNRHDGR
jgi:hypothetical protein